MVRSVSSPAGVDLARHLRDVHVLPRRCRSIETPVSSPEDTGRSRHTYETFACMSSHDTFVFACGADWSRYLLHISSRETFVSLPSRWRSVEAHTCLHLRESYVPSHAGVDQLKDTCESSHTSVDEYTSTHPTKLGTSRTTIISGIGTRLILSSRHTHNQHETFIEQVVLYYAIVGLRQFLESYIRNAL